ncbi:type II toxin-antitoxin system Phd/YefM family antitoxin [Candidatus Oleimmundimicrobium sp.]|uniref:type II toxin-antitoxin system Phd/YefM family antitoxin n=1 Tax=Candidatus Oleimmundimicrobium sp. TaxID=3060597 RepID=UPI0027285739|nr:type II toxin-antitoxin system Phd/YefM family antitoxin [Candidatus Oleimmundimicrobium sp.]MDO8886449.1 type II toxin-antitoxin system Phd/YefM family antitoxin [Candidatus Oleimmundimicrobium sp.]
MSKIIGVTEARSKLKEILDDISRKREPYILTRGSKPEAVIIPYEEYLVIEEQIAKLWDERFEIALKKSRAFFNEWLRKKGYDPEKLTEEEVERIIRSA